MITSFSVPGKPTGKARPKVNTITHRAYTPAKTKEYEKLVRESFQKLYPQKRHAGAVTAEIIAHYQIPKSLPKSRREAIEAGQLRPIVKPDLDNVAKAILDALNGLAYADDSAVVSLSVSKYYSNNPRVDVHLYSGGDLP